MRVYHSLNVNTYSGVLRLESKCGHIQLTSIFTQQEFDSAGLMHVMERHEARINHMIETIYQKRA